MADFSRFDGDDNDELFALQRSVWWGRGYESALVQFFDKSIWRYRDCAESIGLIDPITIILNRGCHFPEKLFSPFLEIISAYYRFIWGYQYRIPFPGETVLKTKDDWVNHYRNFIIQEGEYFSLDRDFFPNIIHLIVIQNLPYANDLQKYLLLIVSRRCNVRINERYDREIPFMSSGELDKLEKHNNQFEMLYRDEIVRLIQREKLDNTEFVFKNNYKN